MNTAKISRKGLSVHRMNPLAANKVFPNWLMRLVVAQGSGYRACISIVPTSNGPVASGTVTVCVTLSSVRELLGKRGS